MKSMKDKLKQLEILLDGQSRATSFSQTELLIYPKDFRLIHSYNLFGNNLLSIPSSLITKGNDDDFETPFSFTDTIEIINIFESEFRTEIPNEFVQIGNLVGSTEIVLLNKLNDNIHIFHISDISDKDWLKCKLENAICSLNSFIENIRPQTVCCLINPADHSKWEMLEIRNNTSIITENSEKKFKNIEDTWIEYWNLIKASICNGYEIHYAPKKVIDKKIRNYEN